MLGLFLRFFYPTLIEFSYDPALFSDGLIRMVENKDFMNARDYYILDHYATGAYNIGPLYFYLRIPFILITKNPVAQSMIMAFLNSLVILLCYLIGKRYFNENVGLISASLYAVNPWAIIFSRNVIPYAFIPIFIAIFVYCLFDIVHKKRSKKILLCLISSVVLIQLVQWGLLVPIILVVAFVFLRPKINWKFFIIGSVICLILLFPHFYWDIKHDSYDSKNLMNAVTKLAFEQGDFLSKFEPSKIYYYFDYYLKVGSAQRFEQHLGYALDDFKDSLHPIVKLGIKLEYFLILFGFIFVFFAFIYDKIKSYSKRKKNEKFIINSYALLLIWVFVTLISFIIFQPKDWPSLPRYYLFFFPSQFIFVGLLLDKLLNFNKVSKKIYLKSGLILLLLLIIVANSVFVIHYFRFLNNYNYDNWLSSNSDIPYKFSYDALSYIQSDSQSKGYEFITVSDDIRRSNTNNPNPGINYLMKYVFNNWYDKEDRITNKTLNYYVISSSKGSQNLPKNIENIHYKKFGPYYVFPEKELVNDIN